MVFNISHYLVPRESNNFKPKTIHSSALIFYITVVVLLQVGFNVLSFIKPGVLGYATDISIGRLLELTNQKRLENGLGSLTLDSQLSQAAAAKASDMFSNNYWSHNSPAGRSPWDFILGAGYHYVYAGENLAKDFANSDGVVSAWMASPTHRDNVVNPKYKNIGFAVLNGKLNGLETTLVVQMFGSKAPTFETSANQTIQPETPTIIPEITKSQIAANITLPPAAVTVSSKKVAVAKQSPPEILIANLKNSSSKTNPKINIFSLTKQISLILVIILVLVLGVDGYIAFKDKQMRISGDNIAHIGFLGILIIAILITSVGMIR